MPTPRTISTLDSMSRPGESIAQSKGHYARSRQQRRGLDCVGWQCSQCNGKGTALGSRGEHAGNAARNDPPLPPFLPPTSPPGSSSRDSKVGTGAGTVSTGGESPPGTPTGSIETVTGASTGSTTVNPPENRPGTGTPTEGTPRNQPGTAGPPVETRGAAGTRPAGVQARWTHPSRTSSRK